MNLGQLYMRGALLDTFTELGMRSLPNSRPRAVRDEDDGLRDGWARLSERPLRELIWIDVQQQSFRTKGGGLSTEYSDAQEEEFDWEPDYVPALPPELVRYATYRFEGTRNF